MAANSSGDSSSCAANQSRTFATSAGGRACSWLITSAAVMTALNYRDELEKASGSADNMRRQIKDYLEDAASAKMAAEEARRENVSLKRRIDELERRLRRNQFPVEDE